MFADSVALALAAAAAWLAHRPAGPRHSYGFARVEVIAAAINGLLMLAVVAGIAVEAVGRLQAPRPVTGAIVLGTASVGLVVNGVVAMMLARSVDSLNTRAALLHVMGDLLGSVAALLAGAIVLFTGFVAADALLSLVISALILFSTLKLLRESLHVLMEGVPLHLDLERVGEALARVPGVMSVHDLHIWTLSSGRPALSAHVVLEEMQAWPRILGSIEGLLAHEYDIRHITLQPELGATVVPLHRTDRPPRGRR
jgi:cobalt-zinc-cadmium efflux system protein